MKKTSAVLALLFIVSLSATSAFAQAWRGNGRMQGVVTDMAGKPVQGATVMLRAARGSNQGPDVKTDKKGKWAALGLIGGAWNIDVAAPGFVTRQMSVQLSEVERMPPIPIKLEADVQVQAAAPEQPQQVAQVGGQAVGPEIAAAIERGNALMSEANALGNAAEEAKKLKYVAAAGEYSKALAGLPDNIQIKQVLAQAYYNAGRHKDAIKVLKEIVEADPTNTAFVVLLADLLIQQGDLEAGKACLAKLPAEAKVDPGAYVNMGIHLLNTDKAADAWAFFDRAISADPTRGDIYYYRGRASLQQNKLKDAKADFQKTVELSPDSTEGKDAADLLKQMK